MNYLIDHLQGYTVHEYESSIGCPPNDPWAECGICGLHESAPHHQAAADAVFEAAERGVTA